ncbi:translation elongation factor Ts [Halobacteriovorax marinus]|uniref:Elongation factor Ts n=1 Tax=Halobacteriovorax marinus (strain ATCC BAA-682 / DSM 15412 / SJ) TaxID=862908 RepID=E1X2W6_HALMS|nr:translation elongation factor Ts [Halobacteriovorax marinus]ATH06589.1 translation elongation factor Ts [Halobacteriovorax marinus]CBW25161.1 Elongation factor Ts [Halobacteriovorax marinus SJ]
MAISAKDVKDLREKTGAGMMDCKKALTETNGDLEAAVDYLRTKGLAKAAKKASRIAAEGTVVTLVEGNNGVILEVNCETDFVSKGDDFQGFAKNMAEYALSNKSGSVDELKSANEGAITELTMKCGEKVDPRRLVSLSTNGLLGSYNHGGKIGVIVDLETDKADAPEVVELAKDISMHVAAAAPTFLSGDDIDEGYKTREADVYRAQLKEEGKPEEMIEKIVLGKLGKLAKEVCLLEQAFIKNPDLSIKKLVAETASKVGGNIAVKSFHKINLGEGIEKKEDNLADEVAKMTSGQ